jgi:glutamate-ammonia-ligase adenylyltransferase
MTDRQLSDGGRLVRLGFVDVERAQRILEGPRLAVLLLDSQRENDEDLLTDLSTAADPDQALAMMDRLASACDDPQWRRLSSALTADELFCRRVVDVLGMSEALGDFLVRHVDQWEVLADDAALAQAPSARSMRAALVSAVGANPDSSTPVATGAGTAELDSLRVAYRTQLLGIAARDLTGMAPMEAVAAWLSDLADAVLEAALAIARAGVGPAHDSCRFAVIGMGKCGGRELNYVSDVDVIFVTDAADDAQMNAATALATGLMRACTTATAEGSIWEVDAALRPEGKQGALVRTIESHVSYYERWASTWEFQALLKARPVAGDRPLGEEYVDSVQPFVWQAASRPGFVTEAQAMRLKVEKNLPARLADRELKLGPGGLRDVEFSVQLLQLVHGRTDVMLRSPTTLTALESLATWGYVGRSDAAAMAEAYRFLRTLEHHLQLHRLRRTHTMPEDPVDLRRLGRSMGFRSNPVTDLIDQWRRHAREVRRIHEKLFYRPLLQAVARLDPGEARLSIEAAGDRLAALGYVDPQGAIRHLQALTAGVSRRAAIQRTLLPVMLGWFADAPDPDAGLLGFRRVSDALGATHWYLGLLRDESVAAERMARVLGTSRFVTGLLMHAPESVSLLAHDADLEPRSTDALMMEISAIVDRHDEPEAAVSAVRAMRRRELFRNGAAEVLGLASPVQTGSALSAVATVTLEGALRVAQMTVEDADAVTFTIIGMGRLGGHELGFGSDVDVMFVYEPRAGVDDEHAHRTAAALAEEVRRLLMAPSEDPPLDVDARLRPEGKQGPLVRSRESYAAYYERWSSVWEAQALVRADIAAGDPGLGARFLELIDPVRWAPPRPAEDIMEIRRLKARMESERLPRGADPQLHTKLGRGGLSDVEWTVQLLQMQHAWEVPSLRTTRTLAGLDAAREAGLLAPGDVEQLRSAWLLASAVRNAIMLVRGMPGDIVPTDTVELRAVAFVLGYPLDDSGRLIEDYRRTTRRARQVFERVFYGASSTG